MLKPSSPPLQSMEKNIFYKTLVPERLEAAAIKKKKKKLPGMKRGRKLGPTRGTGENQSIKPKPEMTWITELVDKDIFKAIITAFYVFKKPEKKLAH